MLQGAYTVQIWSEGAPTPKLGWWTIRLRAGRFSGDWGFSLAGGVNSGEEGHESEGGMAAGEGGR